MPTSPFTCKCQKKKTCFFERNLCGPRTYTIHLKRLIVSNCIIKIRTNKIVSCSKMNSPVSIWHQESLFLPRPPSNRSCDLTTLTSSIKISRASRNFVTYHRRPLESITRRQLTVDTQKTWSWHDEASHIASSSSSRLLMLLLFSLSCNI